MTRPSIKIVILANAFAAVLFLLVAGLWAASALRTPPQQVSADAGGLSDAETLYRLGRYDLLRETADHCRADLKDVVADALRFQRETDRDTAFIAICALAMLVFNILYLRETRRELDALRRGASPQ